MKRKLPTHYEKISEKAFTAQVIKLARFLGWRTAHFRPAQTQRGNWVTPVQGDGAGFPDLVLVHPKRGRLIFAELKSEIGRIAPEQTEWLKALVAVEDAIYRPSKECVHVAVWRPSDIEIIEEILKD